jgi:hypothetical protein
MNSPSEGFAEARQLEDIKLSQLLSAAAENGKKISGLPRVTSPQED